MPYDELSPLHFGEVKITVQVAYKRPFQFKRLQRK